MTVPSVAVATDLKKNTIAEALRARMESAAIALDNIQAWPECVGEISIVVVGKDLGDTKYRGMSMGTTLNIDASAPRGVIRREAGTVVEIRASVNFFVDEIGARLASPESGEDDVAFYALAHEIHHIDECERMAACGIDYQNRTSSLAGAARPDFPEEWKAAICQLTSAFPLEKGCPDLFKTAGDIANEASADLSALYWMRRAGRDWKAFADRLMALRTQDFAARKPSSGLFRFGGKQRHRAYDIAEALALGVATGLVDLPSTHALCWMKAVEKLLESGDLRPPLRPLLRSLPPFAGPSGQATAAVDPATAHGAPPARRL